VASKLDIDALIDATPAHDIDALIDSTPAAATPQKQSGVPDLGILNALRTQLANGLSKSGFDEGVGAAFSQKSLMPGAHLRMPDGTMVAINSQGDAYRAGRDFLRQEQESAQKYHPWLGGLAQMGGELASDYALAGPKAIGRGYQTLAGLARGLLSSNTDLTPDKITAGDAGYATLSTLAGGTIGNLAPVVAGKVANAAPVKYLGSKIGAGTEYAANKLQDLAGWLKVNSIHPTPLLGEAMENVPGGVPAVGRELLDRGLGGFTKSGTAKQIEAAKDAAGAAIDDLVKAHDAAGGNPVNVGAAIQNTYKRAQELIDEPTTKAVGARLKGLLDDYAEKFTSGKVTAEDALSMKRALGKVAYGEREMLKRTGDVVGGEYGKGVANLERGVDSSMDQTLGPTFEANNLTFRRLLGASQAAARSAARTTGNHVLGLLPMMAGVGGAVGGHMSGHATGDAALYGLGALLLGKYGAQAGARGTYMLGQLLKASPQLAEMGVAPAAQRAASRAGESLADLLKARSQPLPSFASGESP
jgi:hypothetical protein